MRQLYYRIKVRQVLVFVFFSFALSWLIIEGYFYLGGKGKSLLFTLIALLVMMTPAFAAMITNKLFGYRLTRHFSLNIGFSRWYVLASTLPVLIMIVTIIISSMLPDVAVTDGLGFIEEQLNQTLPEQESEKILTQISQIPTLLFYLIIIIAGMLAGTFVNVFPALGEEIGWRGFLQKEFVDLGFWKSSIAVGIIWGLWHSPMILRGHNYPDKPVLGILMMIVITILLSPILYYLKMKSNSVIPSAIFHGVVNAIAALPIIILSGGNRLLTGMTGIAGMLALLGVNIILFFKINE